MKYLRPLVILTVLLICALLAAGCTSSSPAGTTTTAQPATTIAPAASSGSIIVFAGAGLKAPLDEIGTAFAQKYGIDVQYNYGGAGTLVTQMNLTKKGDVFMPGSTVEFQTAKDQGLVTTSQLVAYHVPVIAVQKGNPKNITTLADFARPGLKIALGDANATAIGKAGAKMFKKLNITAAVEKNVVTRTPTINELTVFMNLGQADAALLTLDQIDATKVDAIVIPVKDNNVLVTPIGATTFSQNTGAADKFVAYVASDEGKAFFAKHGFPIYPDPVYASVTP
ncbi:molybdate ABC transporter substrate-binding protein [Methanoregula sp.]|uniref:molybdate ABC transporter substrate-binding protein n=1 Tax=Methanoregula sp. TaxID=2052170 RepID=UPI00236C76CA|nr:molybdate ABC transporter substrate-binding protein [Methanoregula sp.]MDD1687828.1 molybdate ABC transporter substrate-binding protein [Methanoregula sp.]